MKRKFLCVCLLFGFCFSFAQTTSLSEKIVDSLTATVLQDSSIFSIKLQWENPKSTEIKCFHIYKSPSQIFSSSLQNLEPIDSVDFTKNEYIDVSSPNSDVFYAVISELHNGTKITVAIPSFNSLVLPISMKKDSETIETIIEKNREITKNQRLLIPLPYLNISEKDKEGQKLDNSLVLTTKNYGTKKAQPNSVLSKEILPEETVLQATGEQYFLTNIIQNSFTNADWAKAEEELTIFLQVNRHKDIVSRARFYRAQTYYFQGYFREAIKEFLNCTDTLNPRTKKWISSCLLKMSL